MTTATSIPSFLRKRSLWKWVAGVGTAVIVVLVGLWCAWSRIAANRLQREVDRIRASGEPLLPSDFKQPFVPDEQNAAIPLARALSVFARSPKSPSFLTEIPPYPPEWHQMAQAAIAANQQSLELAHRAALRPGVNWHGTTPPYSAIRLASLLANAAIDAHSAGDDELAIQHLTDLNHEVAEIEPDHLLAIGIGRMLTRALETILPDLAVQGDIAGNQSPHGNLRPVARSKLLQLRDELLDQKSELDAMRMFALQVRSRVYQAMQTLRGQATMLRPMADLESVRVLDEQNTFVLLANRPNFVGAEDVLNRIGVRGVFRYSRVISDAQLWSDGWYELDWHEVTERRVAAIAIAIRLYRANHDRWPADLRSLVPEFLARVPTDPLIPGNRPIEYVVFRSALPDGRDRPMLRFALRAAAGPSHPIQRPCFGVSTDAAGKYDVQWRDLSRWYPPPPSGNPKGR